jgi:hypothetical protein
MMSRGEGGGVTVIFGYSGLFSSREKRCKLTQPIEIDTHLTQKTLRDEARAKAERHKKRTKIPPLG